GQADRLDDDVGAEAAGQLAHPLDGVLAARVDGVGGAELLRGLELPRVAVDGDDRRRAGDDGTGDGGVADAPAPDDGDGLAAGDLAGVDGGAEAGHDAAPEQPDRGGGGVRVDLGALAGGDEGLLGEGADAQRGAEHGAVGERHGLLGVVGVEAVVRLALATGTALAAHGAPVEDDRVAGCDLGDALTDGLDDA